jgi:two-component system, cell cycle response regulator
MAEVERARKSILLVEDDSDMQELVRGALEREGYDVVTADGGLDALSQVQARSFDLVLSDVGMAHGDGFTFVSELRSVGLRDVPVIMMSAQHGTDRRVSALSLGADDFLPKPLALAELLARVKAHLRRAGRQAELTRDSLRDPLTQLLNRRGFAEVFKSHAALLRRRPGNLSLLMLDLDDFKEVNDEYGHTAGDRALVEVGRALSQVVRVSDRVGRLGGDEFAILLPEADADTALALCGRVRALCPMRVPVGKDVELAIELSLGAATAKVDEPLDDLIARADAAMYAEKRRHQSGRFAQQTSPTAEHDAGLRGDSSRGGRPRPRVVPR